MGRVVTTLKLWKNTDPDNAVEGSLPPERVRSLEIEALVDTGATMLALPRDLVDALGLPLTATRPMREARGIVVGVDCVKSLQLEILGRVMTCDALVIPEGATPLIGQIQLEALDLIVDAKS